MKRGQQQQPAKRQQWLMIGLVVGGLLLILAGVLARRPNSPTTAIDENDPQLVAMGEEVYNTYCAACHGFDLEGEANWQQPNPDGSFRAPPHDETGHTWHHSDSSLVESIRLGGARLEPNVGVSAMPAYDDVLTDQQIAAVLAYIKSQWSTEILEAQEAR
ncbi:MAG: cytochrome c [Candidatus Promineifilaceae bacterium]